jgi:hypothetical protein
MHRPIVQIYAAAVCFVSVSCFAIALGIAAHSAIGVFAPSLTANPMTLVPPVPAPQFPFPPTPDAMQGASRSPVSSESLSPEEAARRKAEALENGLHRELVASRQSLLRWIITGVISGLLFFAHWRILRAPVQRVA